MQISHGESLEAELMTVVEVAALLRRPAGTLGQWRHRGYGPRSFRLGGRVVYRRAEVERWVREQEKATAS
jgi:predicted DNA-binding transcriptional regulator AlpA